MEFKRFALAMVGHFLASLLYVLRRLRILNAAVDTTSYLEHREELKELWEKRMMADDNQSPSSSLIVADDKAGPKAITAEEGSEEEVARTSTQSETKPDTEHKLSNGIAKPSEESKEAALKEGVAIPNGHAHVVEPQVVKGETSMIPLDVDVDNNNHCPDSLEADVERTYTSETSLVMKPAEAGSNKNEVVHAPVVEAKEQEVEVVQKEEQVEKSTSETPKEDDKIMDKKVEEKLEETLQQKTEDNSPVLVDTASERELEISTTSASTPDVIEAHLPTEEPVVPATSSEKEEVSHVKDKEDIKDIPAPKVEDSTQQVVEEVSNNNEVLFKSLEIPQSLGDGDDGFVRLEECLPQVENPEAEPESFVMVEDQKEEEKSIDITEKLIAIEDEKIPLTNGHDASPDPPPAPHPEMEHFVKSGGVKRVLPGAVQQTEQPYSTCTTETKIAMEIREMREREEELRVMREAALLSPVPPKSPVHRTPSPQGSKDSSGRPAAPSPTPSGYRVSSVFGAPRPTPSSPVEDDRSSIKVFKGKESTVEKEIRIARDREEELRKLKGLPPREDDSYVKPSQVKSSQVRVFGKMAGGGSQAVKQAATAKIQLEIEEQTQREMALRDTGSIQTISQERTDSRVAKLMTEQTPITNGNGHVPNGVYTNGRSSPDVVPAYKRGSPSPTGPRPASIFSQPSGKGGISMHKFINSKGKESTFAAPKGNGVVAPPYAAVRDESVRAAVPPNSIQLKRTVSVESKIQQEIMEMKQREEELKMLHMNQNNTDRSAMEDQQMNHKNNYMEYENGNGFSDDDMNPRHNNLIAQWEQRIQKAES